MDIVYSFVLNILFLIAASFLNNKKISFFNYLLIIPIIFNVTHIFFLQNTFFPNLTFLLDEIGFSVLTKDHLRWGFLFFWLNLFFTYLRGYLLNMTNVWILFSLVLISTIEHEVLFTLMSYFVLMIPFINDSKIRPFPILIVTLVLSLSLLNLTVPSDLNILSYSDSVILTNNGFLYLVPFLYLLLSIGEKAHIGNLFFSWSSLLFMRFFSFEITFDHNYVLGVLLISLISFLIILSKNSNLIYVITSVLYFTFISNFNRVEPHLFYFVFIVINILYVFKDKVVVNYISALTTIIMIIFSSAESVNQSIYTNILYKPLLGLVCLIVVFNIHRKTVEYE